LVRALIDWIVDNDCTPYIVLATTVDDVVVPREHVTDDKIVLNVSGSAIRNFSLEDELIVFDSRFNGQDFRISAPVGAVVGVYAKESGQGMAFEVELPAKPDLQAGPVDNDSSDDAGDEPPGKDGKGPHLKLV